MLFFQLNEQLLTPIRDWDSKMHTNSKVVHVTDNLGDCRIGLAARSNISCWLGRIGSMQVFALWAQSFGGPAPIRADLRIISAAACASCACVLITTFATLTTFSMAARHKYLATLGICSALASSYRTFRRRHYFLACTNILFPA